MKLRQPEAAVRLSSPPDIIGAVPSMVGFHPSDSLVLVGLHGPRQRAGFLLRADLPETGDADVYATELAGRVAHQNAGGVILVCYASEADAGGELPRKNLVDLLLEELLLREIGCVEALLVRAGRWWSYTCDKPCCPREGTRLPASPSNAVSALEAQRALHGLAVLPEREALERSISGPTAERLDALRRYHDDLGARLVEEVSSQGVDAIRRQTVDLARSTFRRFARGERDVDEDRAVRILLGLQDKWLRDVMLTWGLSKRSEEVIAFLTCLAQCAPDESAPPICTVLAAVAYQNGHGALASVALDRALLHEPDYELARLLAALLDGQVSPNEIRAMARRTQRELGQRSIDDELSAA